MENTKIILCLFFFCFLFVYTVQQTPETSSSHAQVQTHELIVTNIETNLLQHQWEEQELPCLQKTLDILKNLKNQTLWATWVWDSMQRPTGMLYGTRNQLGNFKQCIHPPWIQTHPKLQTQYCLADIVFTEKKEDQDEDPYITAGEYVSSWSKNKFAVNKLTWGLCLPTICKTNSIKKFAETLLRNSHLSLALPEASITINSCQTYNETTELSYGYYATFCFIGIMIFITLISTIYYEYHRNTIKETFDILLAKAFSVTENTAEFFKADENAIRSLNSLKFLTSCFLVYMHFNAICLELKVVKNLKSFEHFVKINNLHVLYHLEIVVDTFIMISGILLIKSLSTTKKLVSMNVVIKRYIRLTYLPMVLILFITQVMKYHTSGPIIPKTLLYEVENCKSNWWTILLTINNYMDIREGCFISTWSNSLDFHLTILGTGLYWLCQKNNSLGLKVYFMGAVTSVVLPTLTAFYLRSSPIPLDHVKAFDDFITYVNTPIYLHTHLRSGPYFIGLAFGCLLSAYKPENYKKLSINISIIIFAFGLGLALFILMFGGHLALLKYSAIEAALYAGTNRTIWAIAMGAIIVSCEYGHIPLLSDFLRWRIFGPLSKLCFGLYLTHWLVLRAKISTTLNPDHMNLSYMAIDCLGVITFCCGLSYLLWLVFEAPMNNILAIVLRNRSKQVIEIETSGKNIDKDDVKKII